MRLLRAPDAPACSVHVEITEDETVSFDDVADLTADRLREAGARVDERVEFSPLAARVDVDGQLGEQALVVLATDERAVKLLRVDAYEHGAEAGGDELAREASGVPAPKGKEAAPAPACG
jgi:hypothetical protein